MTRNKLLVWVFLALLGAGAAFAVVRHRIGMEAPSVQASAPAHTAEAAPAAAVAHAAAPASEPSWVPTFAITDGHALEQRLAAIQGTEAGYAYDLGVDLRPGQTFAEYVADLETRIARGDAASMLDMAHLLKKCWQSHSWAEEAVSLRKTPADDPEMYDIYMQTARLCNGALVLVDKANVENRAADLIVEAARGGNEAAILAQLANLPYWLRSNPESTASQAWLIEAADRLQTLASAGNATAAARLGDLYSGWQLDYGKAAAYYRQVLDAAPVRVEEAHARMLLPGPDQGRYIDLYLQLILTEQGLDAACEKLPPGSAAAEACH